MEIPAQRLWPGAELVAPVLGSRMRFEPRFNRFIVGDQAAPVPCRQLGW